ncbi:MAG: aspartate aminotransferase family protein [Nitrospiraceae bacterium]|nr:aspartate aminotransferase family protein [Nitrospiraceae bacterium]MDA8262547.1 aspartate aminotransferase family protein [Actinomycetota bacterium]
MTETAFWHPFANMADVTRSRLTIAEASGNYVYDDSGRQYLDATASLWYANVGHGRKEIADAISAQAGKLAAYSTFADITNEPAELLAAKVAGHSPMPGSKVFFVSGGGDAVDTAAKLARRYFHELGHPERQILVSRKDSYHGTHGFGTSLAGMPANRAGYGDLINSVAQIDRDDPEDLARLAANIGGEHIAAVFVEPVIGAGGVHLPKPGYIERIREICTSIGALLVIDSVICGFGRLGEWFGPERFGVVPDMIAFAKGITSGYVPLGGVVVSGEVSAPFFEGKGAAFRHGPTYAGHPLACAAGLANLQIMERENLITRGRTLEGSLAEALNSTLDSPLISETRAGLGLLGAIEVEADVLKERPATLGRIQMAMRERGVLVRTLLTSIAVSPPLTVTEAEIERIGNAFADSLKQVAAES